MRIAFIGTGVMGRSMAGHLLAAGNETTVYNRTKSKADELVGNGARWAPTPAEASRGAEVVFTIVGFPDDVEEVYFGSDGIFAAAERGAILVDMTTSRPDLAVRIADEASGRGMQALDAPVSGGDVGAREARLSIMVGGDEKSFATVKPLFDLMGANIVLQGPPGSGQHTKMCNQIAIAAGMLGVCESMAYAQASGLDPERVLESIASGAAGSWSLSNLAPRMIAGNFAPGFYVKHFIKDLSIAIESADQLGLSLPGLDLAKRLYVELAESGGEDDGTQALFKRYLEQL